MKITELSQETLARIKLLRIDALFEKHEGPLAWEFFFGKFGDRQLNEQPDFMQIDGEWVLLPVTKEEHQYITILRTIWGEDRHAVTIFLRNDYQYCGSLEHDFVAICERYPGEDFYLAIFYHNKFETAIYRLD